MVCFVINIWVSPQLGTPHETLHPISNHLLVLITTSILVVAHQAVTVFCLRTKSHLCVKGETSFWVRHVATIPAFLIVKCQSETEEVLSYLT